MKSIFSMIGCASHPFRRRRAKAEWWAYDTLEHGFVVCNLNDEKYPICQCYGPDRAKNARLIADALNEHAK